jgi:peptidoglycan/LPS O-acetylase OafA/YrhL
MRLEYRSEVDGMRALAIILVLMFHAYPSWLSGGFIGVDVFFTISGYLITCIILTELRSGQFSLTDFYIRRANRLFPSLLAVTSAVLVLGWFALFADEYKSLGRSTAAGAAFIANINAYFEVGYWDVASKYKPLLHLWSLGVEEQFYFVLPLLLWLAWRTKINSFVLLVACTLASFLLAITNVTTDSAANFYLPLHRAWELLFGALLASLSLLFTRQPAKTNTTRHVAALTGLSMILFAAVFFDKATMPTIVASLLAVVGCSLLIWAGSTAWINQVIFSSRIFIYIGRISYPLYLWHWPLLSFAYIVDGRSPSSATLAFILVLSVALASITYHCIEQPLRLSNLPQGAKAAGTTVMLAIIGGLGYCVFVMNGIPSRQIDRYHATDFFTIQRPPVIQEDSHGCFNALPALFKTQLQAGQMVGTQVHCQADRIEEITIALIGDSNAGQYAKDLSDQYGRSLLTIHSSGRPYIRHINHDAISQEILSFLAQQPSIKTVVLAHLGVQMTQGDSPSLSNMLRLTNPNYELGLKQTIQTLQAAGKRVIWLGSIPILDFDPKSCHTRPFSLKQLTERCTITRAELRQTHRPYLEAIKRIRADMPNLEIVDAMDYLCDLEVCYAKKEGVILYADKTHLNQYGSSLVAQPIIRAIETSK